MSGAILEAAAKLAADEPLLGLLRQGGANPGKLFGGAIYAVTIETMQRRVLAQRTVLQQRLPKFHKRSADAQAIARQIEMLELVAAAARRRELRWIEPALVEAFWEAYEQAAVLLAGRRVDRRLMPHLRAFSALRHDRRRAMVPVGRPGGAPAARLPAVHRASGWVAVCHPPLPRR